MLVFLPLVPSHFLGALEVEQLTPTRNKAKNAITTIFLLLVFIPLLRGDCRYVVQELNKFQYGF